MDPIQSNHIRIDPPIHGVATLWLDMADRRLNVLNHDVLAELEQALDSLAAEPDVRLLMVRSGNPSGFAAGADIREFPRLQDPDQAAQFSAFGQQVFDKLAQLPAPTIAVLHGVCLGGALELAMACDYRLAVQHPQTQLGLPEIELGLAPGWGGTQRLSRIVGLQRALQMILGRKRLDAAAALRWGLVDAVAKCEDDLPRQLRGLRQRALKSGKRRHAGRPARSWRQWPLESTSLGRRLLLNLARRQLAKHAPADMPAPWEALQAIEAGLARRGPEHGLSRERRAVKNLATSAACRNLVRLFLRFQQARQATAPAQPRDGRPSPRRIGVVGTGTMGAGIVQLILLNGRRDNDQHAVDTLVIHQPTDSSLSRGLGRVQALLDKAVDRGLLSSSDARRSLASIQCTTRWEGFDRVDLVIESVTEDLGVKRKLFQELERRTRPSTILATNTSSLLVSQLQEGLGHPSRVAGLHFFHPVHRIPLVEIVRAPATDDATIDALHRWACELGKAPLVVQDSRGFVVNRILMPYVNEAMLLLSEGMPADRIDHVMRRFGMPLGPLELLDRAGLDVAAHIALSMQPELGSRFAPNTLLERMCSRGWLGTKAGTGFYVYGARNSKRPNAALRRLARNGQRHSSNRAPDQLQQARDRMVGLMINESADCLAKGLLPSAEAIDLAMVLGTGWAPHRGGPLRHCDSLGLQRAVRQLERLARQHGPRFQPTAELLRRAAAGESFYAGRQRD